MWALDEPYRATVRPFVAGTPWRIFGLVAVVLGVAVAATQLGHPFAPGLTSAASWSAQAALACTAVAWARVDDPTMPRRALGLTVRPGRGMVLMAVAIGAGLGAHLLVTASRTLGYPIVVDRPGRLLGALVYDVALNVPCAELFFRGAVFNRAQRRWSLGPALLGSTLACSVRYLADPALLKIPEVLLGAVVYIVLLSVANAWLFWRSGSLVPPLIVSFLFFCAYRTLRVE